MSPEKIQPHAGGAEFATTRWSIVLAARAHGAPHAQAALENLCQTYWLPLYAYLRGVGCAPEEAEDIVQGFFARLLEKGDFAQVSPERGRFRSFLLAAVKHFLANERDRARAIRRGGGRAAFSLDVGAAESRYAAEACDRRTPETVFDRQWALTLLARVEDRLRGEFASAGKAERFAQLHPLLSGESGRSYGEAAAALGLTENAVMVAVHRLRQRFRELLREEIAQTLSGPEQIDDEIRDLFAALQTPHGNSL
jgi:DNA-directed RNA polymerase specialized sigma24 family protein